MATMQEHLNLSTVITSGSQSSGQSWDKSSPRQTQDYKKQIPSKSSLSPKEKQNDASDMRRPSLRTSPNPADGSGMVRSSWMRRSIFKTAIDVEEPRDSPTDMSRGSSFYEEPSPPPDIKLSTVSTVMASYNKMQMLRSRTLASKGNFTKLVPLKKFNPEQVTNVMEEIVCTALKGVKYEPKICALLSKTLSNAIKTTVKNLKFPRYKFVCVVTITPKAGQGMMIGSRAIWNANIDNSATYEFSNDSLYAVAIVYAIFYE